MCNSWQGFYCVFHVGQYFQISSKISNFQREKILRISKDFIEIIFKFSNFHSISKRNFWFCKIHLWKNHLHSNWERKENCQIYRSLDGRVEKSNFWKILVNFWNNLFGKLTNTLTTSQYYNNSQNSMIFFLKLKKFRKKI